MSIGPLGRISQQFAANRCGSSSSSSSFSSSDSEALGLQIEDENEDDDEDELWRSRHFLGAEPWESLAIALERRHAIIWLPTTSVKLAIALFVSP